MTTYLHTATNSLQGTFPPDDERVCVLPCSALCGGFTCCGSSRPAPHAKTARLLLCILVPGQLVFVYSICVLEAGILPTPLFLFAYILASVAQVMFYRVCNMKYWKYKKSYHKLHVFSSFPTIAYRFEINTISTLNGEMVICLLYTHGTRN